MTERIDHAAEAVRITTTVSEQVKEVGDTVLPTHIANAFNAVLSRDLASAQVHATLAIAEQQRIANMQTERRELRARSDGRTDDAALDHRRAAVDLDRRIRDALDLP